MTEQSSNIHRVSLIGAQGGMGRLFTALLEDHNIHVDQLDQPLEPDTCAPALAQADLVLLSVPIQALHEVLPRITPLMPEDTILADVCSVKEHPLHVMLEHFPGPVVGTHPLFGPRPDPGTRLRIAVVPGRDQAAADRVSRFMIEMGLISFMTTAQAHDQALAKIQGLNFVTTISYLAAVAQDEDLLPFLTPSFDRRLKAAQKMLTQDGELFQSLFEANPYSQDAVRHFRSFLNLAAAGDLDLLQDMAAWWWREADTRGGP